MPVPTPTVQPHDQFTDAALITNAVPGARVSLYQNGVSIAGADATSTATRIPLSRRLTPGDTVTAAQELGGQRSALSAPVTVELNHVTYHFDNTRSGWNPHETALTTTTVPGKLTQLFTLPVNGQVYAQPLYVQQLNIPGQGVHNALYVATENDTIYAFDADAPAAPLWQRSLLPTGESVVSSSDVGNCPNISPIIGITGTPVIDRTTNTMYVVAKTKAGTVFHQRLYALDITTGTDRPHSPVEIQGSVQGNADGQQPAGSGMIPFDPHTHQNRAALLLQNGVIYVCFASHCDFTPYHGWILAYDAATLAPVAVFNTTPEMGEPGSVGPGSGGGIWQSGYGPATDSAGYLYLLTGNGPFNHAGAAPGKDFGNSVLKLRPDLSVADFFTPWNQQQLAANDDDLGSGGPLVVPDQPGPTGQLLVACGKEGTIYLLNRHNLSGYNGPPPGTPAPPPGTSVPPGTDKVLQSLPGAVGGVWGGPAFYQGPTGSFVYYCGNDDYLKAFHLVGASLVPAGQTADKFNGTFNPTTNPGGHEGGSIPAVSSNGSVSAGSGIVWAVTRDIPPGPLKLRAYDATNLTSKLFEGDVGPWMNDGGIPSVVPMVINGKVYVGADGAVAVFGLLPRQEDLQVFYRGPDNSLRSFWRDSSGPSWQGEDKIGGTMAGDPCAAQVPGTTVLQVFYRGPDDSLRTNWRDPSGNWAGERPLGGTMAGDPCAAQVPGTTVLQVFYRGPDDSLRTNWRDPSGNWAGERPLGGTMAGDPCAAQVPGTTVLQVFYHGPDDSLRTNWRDPNGPGGLPIWAGERPLGGTMAGDPCAAQVPGTTVLQVFYHGPDDSLRTNWRDPNGPGGLPIWAGERPLGGTMAGDPCAAQVPGTTVLQVFYHGPDNSLRTNWRDPNGPGGLPIWAGERPLGGTMAGDPCAAQVPGTTVLQVFYRGPDNSLRTNWRDPSGPGGLPIWAGERPLGGTMAGDPSTGVMQ